MRKGVWSANTLDNTMDYDAQSALEYLLTYGWTIIIIAIIIGILIFVTSGASTGVICQSQTQTIQVTEWNVKAGSDGVGLTLRNATGGMIAITQIITATGVNQFSGAGTVAPDNNVSRNENFRIMGVTAPTAGTVLSNAAIKVNYTTQGGLPSDATIICNGTVTPY